MADPAPGRPILCNKSLLMEMYDGPRDPTQCAS